MWVLGVNAPPAGWHDSAACLIDGDGNVVAFSEEERCNRRRHSLYRKPLGAARFCLDQAGIQPADIDVVAIGWDVEQLYPGQFGSASEFLSYAVGLDFSARTPEVVHVPHHRAHAASAFYASPFAKAGVLVVDGHGENESSTMWTFEDGREPKLERSWQRSASLGYAYDAASVWLGFSFLNAGKTMGLAAYGRARALQVESLVSVEGDDFRLAVAPRGVGPERATAAQIKEQYDDVTARWRTVYSTIVGADKPSRPEGDLAADPKAVEVAYLAQRIVEETVAHLTSLTRKVSGVDELCLAGGVALNCSTNGTLPGPVYVPPVPHDAGVALGAAWTVCPPRRHAEPLNPYLGSDIDGPGYPVPDTAGLIGSDLDIDRLTELLLAGKIGAVAQGRSEVGPRALCRRSIIAVPNSATVRTRVNVIKNREQWRPFAGVARPEFAARLWEQQDLLSRYMLGAAEVTDFGARTAPAVVHADGTTRPQLLHEDEAPAVGAVLDAMPRHGAAPVLLNTSFNDRGEPIVNTAADALAAFRSMDLDFLVLGDRLYQKSSARQSR
ncbi:carbamoyltransferase C-terminal domain-containing protein [Nocardia iowensis]|uniref:Carbamoyltransferase n=1 Tax=Nocardia iowensis TaxID=204891 RepID=A0ABX8RGZ7_NOCIO|nr:carbamoyltransferase C-terminal domain-containing protein [Nocardia iowensis]QXN88611.1 hypothetical protein KV110_23760 [Nocardia iowensis]